MRLLLWAVQFRKAVILSSSSYGLNSTYKIDIKHHPFWVVLFILTKSLKSYKSMANCPDSMAYKLNLSTGDTGYKNSGKRKEFDMEFLKELLGEELFKQLEAKINEHNGNEANKDKQIKLGNLGSGEYVSKAKHDALQALLDGKTTELDTANGLINELKKGTKGNEELQGKITGYETQVADLQAQLAETKIKSALKVALLSEKALDIDYLTFKVNEKMKEQGKALELDENENIKGWDDVISGLKTQFPTQFEKAGGGKVDPIPLPKGDERKTEPKSLAEAIKESYEK